MSKSTTPRGMTEEQIVTLALQLAKRKAYWERWHNDDYCQDVALAALEAWRSGKMSGIKPEHYIHGIIQYQALAEVRALQRSRRTVAIKDTHVAGLPQSGVRTQRRTYRAAQPETPEQIIMRKQRLDKIRDALRLLRPKYRLAVQILLDSGDGPLAFNCSEKQWRNWKHRGLKQLASILGSRNA